MINIDVLNKSSVVGNDEVKTIVAAIQSQVHNEFYAAWGVDANVEFVEETTDPTHWQLVVLDNSDQAGALGYHDVTASGRPLGKCFAATDQQYGEILSITISHECLEMLVDPEINLTVMKQQPDGSGILYAYESADACQNDSAAYTINGVKVSDFVYPAWFEESAASGTQFDHMNLIKVPFALYRGGYIGIYNITAGNGWTQLTDESVKNSYKVRPPVGSRRERRQILRSRWLRSLPRPQIIPPSQLPPC